MHGIKRFFPPAPPAKEAHVPSAAPAAAEAADEQGFVAFFRAKCKHATRGNSLVMGRKVAVFGKRHAYGADVTHPLSEVPESFLEFANKNKYSYNSVTCNVYEDRKSNIAWHSDAPDALARPEIVSLSFALNKEHQGSKLATMEFRWKRVAHAGASNSKAEALFHGSCVRWDARKHKKLHCEHRVAATRRPRLNVTLRMLK